MKTLQFPPGCLKVDLLCPRTPEGWALELPSWKFLGCLCRVFPSYQVYHPLPTQNCADHSSRHEGCLSSCREGLETRNSRSGPGPLRKSPKWSWPTLKLSKVVLAHFENMQSCPGPLRELRKVWGVISLIGKRADPPLAQISDRVWLDF